MMRERTHARRRRWHALFVAGTVAIGLSVDDVGAALRDVFGHEGFPATYLVKADGTFSTTLFGYQPIEQLRQVASEIAGEGAATTPSSPVPSGGVGRHPPWEKRPLLALLPAPWAQWHPLLVHFPIALLVLEAVFVCALLVRPN